VSRYPKPVKRAAALAPFNPALRYRVSVAAEYLDQSESQTWLDIRAGKLAVIREGSRTFVPGAEIAKRCQPSAA